MPIYARVTLLIFVALIGSAVPLVL